MQAMYKEEEASGLDLNKWVVSKGEVQGQSTSQE